MLAVVDFAAGAQEVIAHAVFALADALNEIFMVGTNSKVCLNADSLYFVVLMHNKYYLIGS